MFFRIFRHICTQLIYVGMDNGLVISIRRIRLKRLARNVTGEDIADCKLSIFTLCCDVDLFKRSLEVIL